MNDKELKIVEMLKQGKSYSDIQAVLSVSPSKISVVKKKFLLENPGALIVGNKPGPIVSDPEEEKRWDEIHTLGELTEEDKEYLFRLKKEMDEKKSKIENAKKRMKELAKRL